MPSLPGPGAEDPSVVPSSGSPSATDIITYIGIPLAVLGVLPILYNTTLTLFTRSKIHRLLRLSRLTGLTRSDIINRVIEVDLPRYAVKPFDRFLNRDEYWSVSEHQSTIPGGSWTTFNWRTNTIGLTTQRVEYADQLRQPQVEVSFDELVAYLLDLGAVPDPQGWRLLRATGLWTPVGSALMVAPGRGTEDDDDGDEGKGGEKVLSVGPLEGADGHLSLRVRWKEEWTVRGWRDLPPYWVRLPAPLILREETEGGETGSVRKLVSLDDVGQEEGMPGPKDNTSSDYGPITCHITSSGLTTALTHEDQIQSTINLDGLPIDHLRIRQSSSLYPSSSSSSSPSSDNGIWFASAATALGTTSQTILWSYRIPDDIISFCRKDSVPCGILVLLGVVDDSATPEWASKDEDAVMQNLERFARRSKEQRDAMMAEAKMPAGPEKDRRVRERLAREGQERLQDMRDKLRHESQRKETRLMEAFQSPKWSADLVAKHFLIWLKDNNGSAFKSFTVHQSHTLKDVAGMVLHKTVLDVPFALAVFAKLRLWKTWADNGGMRRSDMEALQGDNAEDGKMQLFAFAYAAVLVALIWGASSMDGGMEGSALSMDLQECLRLWRVVRLG
ncbi:hypothetical protein B0T20DRAFT_402167 [Sordaria brevicollis]|uniref:Uncharacterized protein n=1 Tax=Sordaria brevicollis TaxID=83679 RepID=A0AAE0PKQ9_SORBR|nr:hypothetical protein B0T20DRAFT_402167 [Sordaria brevicollis]